MTCRSQPLNAMTAGIWLVGVGLMIATRWFWMWLLLLIGITLFLYQEGFGPRRHGILWGSVARASLVIGIPIWTACTVIWVALTIPIALWFIALGGYFIYTALVRPDPFAKAGQDPFGKPSFDSSLD